MFPCAGKKHFPPTHENYVLLVHTFVLACTHNCPWAVATHRIALALRAHTRHCLANVSMDTCNPGVHRSRYTRVPAITARMQLQQKGAISTRACNHSPRTCNHGTHVYMPSWHTCIHCAHTCIHCARTCNHSTNVQLEHERAITTPTCDHSTHAHAITAHSHTRKMHACNQSTRM